MESIVSGSRMEGDSGGVGVGDDPVFDNSLVTNVTAQLGNSAHLPCTVLNIKKNNPVSWIRRRDMHILSVESTVFTQDARFQLHRDSDASSRWTLIIKYLKNSDEGTYVCQVSNHRLQIQCA